MKIFILAALAITVAMPAFAQTKDVYSVHEAYTTRQEINDAQPSAVVAGERMRERQYEDMQDNINRMSGRSAEPREPLREDGYNN